MSVVPHTKIAAIRAPSPPVALSARPATTPSLGALLSLSTPRAMQASLAGLALALAMFGIVGAVVVSDARQGVQTIGHDTAPSVVAAQAIRAHLANLDAEAANAMLTRGAAQAQAWSDYAAEQAKLSGYLVSAAENITYGDAERQPILTIATGVQSYADMIGRARALLETGAFEQSGAPDAALGMVRRAGAMLNEKLLPAAGALNDANETVLNNTWEARKAAFLKERVWLVGAALPGLALLVWLQAFLVQRTRRLINPGLLAATLALAAALLWVGFGAGASAAALTSAKQDAFDSIRAMWRARAVAYSANADESFFLLDPAQKLTYAMTFQKKIVELTDRSFLAAPSRLRYLDRGVAPFQRRDCALDPGETFAGLLGAEMMNVTFAGECAAAANAYRTLAAYLDIDGRIRDLDAAGQRDAAIALNVGVKPGESNFAFDAFDKALGSIIAINQSAFDASVAKAEARLAPLPSILGVGAVLVWGLAFLGLRPRLAEYRS